MAHIVNIQLRAQRPRIVMPSKPTTTARGPEGRVVRPAKNGKTQIMRTGGHRWSAAAEAVFLEHLAATANVRASADAVGFSTVAIYKRRMAEAGFAGRWQRALEQGVARIEMALVHSAAASLEGTPIAGDHPIPAMSVVDAMNVVRLHRAAVHGGKPQLYGRRMELPDIEEVRAEILRKVAVLEREKLTNF
jgi:hypothetical protein